MSSGFSAQTPACLIPSGVSTGSGCPIAPFTRFFPLASCLVSLCRPGIHYNSLSALSDHLTPYMLPYAIPQRSVSNLRHSLNRTEKVHSIVRSPFCHAGYGVRDMHFSARKPNRACDPGASPLTFGVSELCWRAMSQLKFCRCCGFLASDTP